MPRKTRIDMAGVRYGRLVGVAFSHASRSGRAQWLFACDCGTELVADGGNVRAGSTTSCGCYHREVSAARLTTHGHRAGKRHDPTYRAWQTMIDACTNPASSQWRRCGGRGVAVATAWQANYPAFLTDLGERPSGSVLARHDPAGDFRPDNCAWVKRRARPARATAGWDTRRRAEPGQAAARHSPARIAPVSQARSWPPAAASIAPSIAL